VSASETRQRLVANDAVAPDVGDRLEYRMEGPLGDDLRDAVAAPSHLGPLVHIAADERPGQIRELGHSRKQLGNVGCPGRSLGIDVEQTDQLAVVSHGRVDDRVNAETGQKLVVRMPATSSPGLDPGAVDRPIV
jgi:hypothetical protein